MATFKTFVFALAWVIPTSAFAEPSGAEEACGHWRVSMIRRIILASVMSIGLAWPFGATASDSARVFEGTVGAAPIVMSLDISEDSADGSYFYSGKWFDIDLSGDVKKGVLQLESRATGDKLILKPSGAGYVGTLTTSKRKTVPVELRAIGTEAAKDSSSDSEKLNLYEKTRVRGLALKPERTETVAGKTIRWYVEPASGVRLFRLESGYPTTSMDSMNKSMAQIQWREVSDYFACLGADGRAGSEIKMQAGQPNFSDAHVSFALNSNWNCAGAAHPDFGITGHVFDARTGKELSLDDLLKFGKSPAPEQNSDPWYDYRSKTFAPALVSLLKRLYPKEMKKPRQEDACDYTDPQVWSFPTFYLTAKGLYVGAGFPRFARVCDNPEWSVIPFSELHK